MKHKHEASMLCVQVHTCSCDSNPGGVTTARYKSHLHRRRSWSGFGRTTFSAI